MIAFAYEFYLLTNGLGAFFFLSGSNGGDMDDLRFATSLGIDRPDNNFVIARHFQTTDWERTHVTGTVSDTTAVGIGHFDQKVLW